MRQLAWALNIAFLLSASPGMGESPTPERGQRDSLLHIADVFDRAQITKNRAALEQMVADDLVFIEATGKRTGKKNFIDGWTAPGDRYDPVVLVDRVVIPLDNDAFMVTAETTLTGMSDGKSFSSAFRFTDTFKRVKGEWRVVHIQVTRLPRRD